MSEGLLILHPGLMIAVGTDYTSSVKASGHDPTPLRGAAPHGLLAHGMSACSVVERIADAAQFPDSSNLALQGN